MNEEEANDNDFNLHLKSPPKRIFAYQHSHPGNEIMGVAIDAKTGAILQAAILPTRQRVMLALGVGSKDAQAHATYRQFGGSQGYELIWIEDPETDPRTNPLKKRLVSQAQETIQATHEEKNAIQDEASKLTSELTAQLVQQGAEQKDEGGFF